MKTHNIITSVTIAEEHELADDDRRLVQTAKAACRNAYAPYSQFHVGAAARLEDGTIVTGANQENVAYPSGLCAERTAIFAAQAAHPELAVDTLAIAACDENGFTTQPVTPCGACRQVMAEVERRYGRHMRLLLYGGEHVYIIERSTDLLPLSFGDSKL